MRIYRIIDLILRMKCSNYPPLFVLGFVFVFFLFFPCKNQSVVSIYAHENDQTVVNLHCLRHNHSEEARVILGLCREN